MLAQWWALVQRQALAQMGTCRDGHLHRWALAWDNMVLPMTAPRWSICETYGSTTHLHYPLHTARSANLRMLCKPTNAEVNTLCIYAKQCPTNNQEAQLHPWWTRLQSFLLYTTSGSPNPAAGEGSSDHTYVQWSVLVSFTTQYISGLWFWRCGGLPLLVCTRPKSQPKNRDINAGVCNKMTISKVILPG